jgi:hypothetical protein
MPRPATSAPYDLVVMMTRPHPTTFAAPSVLIPASLNLEIVRAPLGVC